MSITYKSINKATANKLMQPLMRNQMIARPERRQRPPQKPIKLHRRDIRCASEIFKQDVPEVRDGQTTNTHVGEIVVDVFLETRDWVKIALGIRMDCLGLDRKSVV